MANQYFVERKFLTAVTKSVLENKTEVCVETPRCTANAGYFGVILG